MDEDEGNLYVGNDGELKGAELTEENVLDYTLWYMRTMHLDSSSRVDVYASFGFDANMMDTYPALLSGAVSSLMIYVAAKGEETLVENGVTSLDNTLTLQILYRLGFRWPVTDSEYVRRFASRLMEKGFFR